MLESIGMMLLVVVLLSVSGSLSLSEPFSRPGMQILTISLGIPLVISAAVVVIPRVTKHLASRLTNRPPQYSHSEGKKDSDASH